MTAKTRFIRTCSIWRALEAIGDLPTILVLEASWLGARRFDQFRARTGLFKALLSDRLKHLVATELFERVAYSETPHRFEYRMTAKGRDLYWTALMMLRWERRWGAHAGKIEVRLTHSVCGEEFEPTPSCSACTGEIHARDVSWREGPGVGWMAASHVRRRRQRASQDGGPSRTTMFDDIAQVTGDRWSSLILRSVFTGLRRFDEIRGDTAIATNILSNRLS
ncbi:MAG: winged helix-turn-helix transcriptional regulator, partial [Caulobacterales bacterium]|nr:winged helix-turn-helix transcriptional regulator [Caulobacterales bacterium]